MTTEITFPEVAKADVGAKVQQNVDAGAVKIEALPNDDADPNGKWTIKATFPN